MSRRSVQRAAWRSIFKDIENPRKPIFPEWVGWLVLVGLLVWFLSW